MKSQYSNILTISLSVLMAMLMALPVQAKEPRTLRQAVSELKSEAKQSIKDKAWLRTNSDYKNSVTLAKAEDKDLLAALMKKQDRNPSVDAYIKWQLIGFLRHGALKDESVKNTMKLIMSAPAYVSYPKSVPSQFTSAWSKVVNKTKVDKRDEAAALKAWEAFEAKYKKPIDTMNYPVIEYRKKLASMIPVSSVVSTYFKLTNLESIIEAGIDPRSALKTNKSGKIMYMQFYSGLKSAKDLNPETRDLLEKKVLKIRAKRVMVWHKPELARFGRDVKFAAGWYDISQWLRMKDLEREFYYALGEKERK